MFLIHPPNSQPRSQFIYKLLSRNMLAHPMRYSAYAASPKYRLMQKYFSIYLLKFQLGFFNKFRGEDARN